MTQVYSDPTRADDPHALPDIETWQASKGDLIDDMVPGKWYFWFCFPGCLPDSDPFGPYETEAAAIEAAQDWE